MGLSGGSVVKTPPANAGDESSIPGLGRSPGGEGMAVHSSILTWRIPETEEPGGLQFKESQIVGHDREAHTCIFQRSIKREWISETLQMHQLETKTG